MSEREKGVLTELTDLKIDVEHGVLGAAMYDAGFLIPTIAEELGQDRKSVITALRRHGRIPVSNPFHVDHTMESVATIPEGERRLHSALLAQTAKIVRSVQTSTSDHKEPTLDATQYLYTIRDFIRDKYGVPVSIEEIGTFSEQQGFQFREKLGDTQIQLIHKQIEEREKYGTSLRSAYKKWPNIHFAAKTAGCSFTSAANILRSYGDTFRYHPFEIDQQLEASVDKKSVAIRREAGLIYGTLFLAEDRQTAESLTRSYLLQKYGIDIPEDAIERKMRYYNELHLLRSDGITIPRALAIENTWMRYYADLVGENHHLIEKILTTLYSCGNTEGRFVVTAYQFGVPQEFIRKLIAQHAGRMHVKLHSPPDLRAQDEQIPQDTIEVGKPEEVIEVFPEAKVEQVEKTQSDQDVVQQELSRLSREELRRWIVDDIARSFYKRSMLPDTLQKIKKVITEHGELFGKVFNPEEMQRVEAILAQMTIAEKSQNYQSIRSDLQELSSIAENPHRFTTYFSDLRLLFYSKILQRTGGYFQEQDIDEIVYHAFLKVYNAYGNNESFTADDFRRVMLVSIDHETTNKARKLNTVGEQKTKYLDESVDNRTNDDEGDNTGYRLNEAQKQILMRASDIDEEDVFHRPDFQDITHEALINLLLALPDNQRTVIEMQYLQGMPPRKIAAVLGIDVDNVYELARYAKKAMQRNVLRLDKNRGIKDSRSK